MSNWIFLRGLTRESGHWGAFVQQFEALVPGAHVTCIDTPGNGRLHGQRSPTTVQAMVEPCRMQLRELGLAPPYRLLAMSMGAMVALAWCADQAHEIEACVLIHPSMKPFNKFYERLRPINYPKLIQLMLPGKKAEAAERAILNMTTNLSTDEVVPQWVALRHIHPVSRTNMLRQLWAASRFRAPRLAGAVPTLVLASTADRLVSSACAKALSDHWMWPLQLHASAGHDLPLDDGPWVALCVQQWLHSARLGETT